jgi:hypothetical protein
MEYLLLKDNEITSSSILGGNIDVDKYKYCISDAQISSLEEILGEDLYEKIKTEVEDESITGLYLILYEKYITPFLIHRSAMEYLKDGAYMVNNGGIYKHTPQNGTAIDKVEVDLLVSNQRYKADIYQQRMEKWLCKNKLTEYIYNSENIVNPKKDEANSGWYF